jgi:hypothetical protein
MSKLFLLPVLLFAAAASADEVHLKDGGKLVGDATKVGDEYVVETPHGRSRVKASEVALVVEGRTAWDDYADKLKAASDDDAAAQLALGDWCRDAGLASNAKKHWTRAVAIDPDQAEARKRLGFVRHDDRWLTVDEYYVARGFVKVGDKWAPAEEARRSDVARRQREAAAKHEKTIRDAVTQMSSMKRKTRAAGKLALQKYAEEIGDLRLASFASEVAAYYAEGWKEIRRALVLVEIRATHATLKRPIPTFTTSLGGFSTPVNIQLPEMSIVSIKTTVLVPADIELDEEP